MNTSEISIFRREGVDIRVVIVDGEPHFVVADLARMLGYRDATNAARLLRENHKGYSEVSTPSGTQTMLVANEKGMYRLILRSNAPHAEAVQDWVTDEVLPEIAKTGQYVAPKSVGVDLATIRQLNSAVGTLLEENEKITARAVHAESTVDFIEGSDGLSVREFHKQYFSDTPETQFNGALYAKHLLIDQRGTRGRDAQGRLKNGKEHRHPTFQGKAFFFLDPTVDRVTGERYYQTKVRPGTPEVELVEWLSRRGMEPNRNAPRILQAVMS